MADDAVAELELSTEQAVSAEPPVAKLPVAFAKEHHVLIEQRDDTLYLLHAEPVPWPIYQEVRRYVGQAIKLKQIPSKQFDDSLVAQYETDSSAAMQMVEGMEDDLDLFKTAAQLQQAEDLLDSNDDAPIIRLINAILSQAIKEDASDVHLETFENKLLVRFRIDGVLRQILEPQRLLAPLLVSRIKVMAKLDISEKRVPQDGRIALKIGGRSIDVRVSTMPTRHGERVVLRLLEKNTQRLDLSNLGLSKQGSDIINKLIHKPHGILLVTGPTGAGKTTTLYAALTVLNQTSRNILTVEDPIEYDLAGIGQTQVNPKVEMTFSKGLRAILRQDPDVVMIGEIRDIETAEIAVQASLTGHLVLSTLHTNTAIGAITRLRDMGVEPFLLATSLIGMVAQRLVRVLCPHCKEATTPNAQEAAFLGVETTTLIYKPVGCSACNQMGYHGRTGIYEIIAVDEDLQRMMQSGATEQEMVAHARLTQPSIRMDGIRRILAGETSIEEVLRVSSED